MRRWILVVGGAGWALTAVVALVLALDRAPFAWLAMGAAACAALCAWLVARANQPARGPGALALLALIAAAVLDALAWESVALGLLALPPLLALVSARWPGLPAGRARWAALALAYLAIAPAVDALLFDSPRPEAVAAPGVTLSPADERELPAGAGRLAERRARLDGSPDVGLVSLVAQPGEDLPTALREAYAPSDRVFFFPFPLVVETRGTTLEERSLGAGWTRVALTTTDSSTVFGLGTESSTKHVFLLHRESDGWRLRVSPPFYERWERHAGYHLDEAGDNAASLRAVAAVARFGGAPLAPPERAYADLVAGEVARETPGAGVFLVALAACGAAAMRRRR